MNLSDITATVMVKNEEYFIGHVLSPLVKRLGAVIVFDTGSTDGTVDIARAVGATVICKGNSSPEQLGMYRTELNQMAPTPWTMVVDGDELYPETVLDDIAAYEVPAGKLLGFTAMCSVTRQGDHYALLDDKFSRVALHPRATVYKGEYPFESPNLFADPGNFFYVPSQNLGYHLHPLVRSPHDERVYMRVDKRPLFSLQKIDNMAVLGPVELPLDPRFPDPYENMSFA